MVDNIEEVNKIRLLSAFGLTRKAGKAIIGTDAVCDSIRAKRALIVIISEYASDNTKKRLINCASYYGIGYVFVSCTTNELGGAVGKTETACIGTDDINFKRLIEKYLPTERKDSL